MPAEGRLSPRKRPRQRRSQETVLAIVEAAARVLAERGYAGASTNRIAERAGVSIGSLYEYFPNKDALVLAVAERHSRRVIELARTGLARVESESTGLRDRLAALVEVLLTLHEEAPRLHHVLFSEAPHTGGLGACVLAMEENLAHSVAPWLAAAREVGRADTDIAAHLIVQTAEALTHRFVHHGIHQLGREAFAAEVVELLLGYLVRGPAGQSRPPTG